VELPMKRLRIIVLVSLTVFTVTGLAQVPFKSAGAKDATSKYEADVKRAADDYQQKVLEAKRVYVKALKDALKGAAKAPNPDADEIANLVSRIKETEAALPSPPQERAAGVRPEDLAGKTVLFTVFASPREARYTLEKNGQVSGKLTPNESSWKVENGKLLFFNANGRCSMVLEPCKRGDLSWFSECPGFQLSAPDFHTVSPVR
jgi:hypothetical protein